MVTGAAPDRPALVRRGLRLEYATLGWNVVGVVVVGLAGLASGSVALIGFGLDSAIEIFASVVVVWELSGNEDHDRTRRALRMIGVAFFVLAAYLLVQGVYVLVTSTRPDASPVGIAWTALTCAVMLALATGKGRTGRALGNAVLITEARVTLVDACLAGAVLVGLVLRAAFGWWWADPVAGFVIVFYGVKEGQAAWRSEA